jgi:hypothetical protein
MDEDIDYDWDENDNINEELDEDEKKDNFMHKDPKRIAKRNEEKAKEEAETQIEKSEFDKKCEKLQNTFEEYNLNAESEVTIEWGKKVEANTNLAWDYDKTLKIGWQFPFTIPAIPIFQFRIGIKAQIYFKITIGIQISFSAEKKEEKKEKKVNFDINPFGEISVGVKMDITAEVGAYTGFLDAYAGIEGTLLDAKIQIKEYYYLLKGYLDFYVNVLVRCLQFRIYAEILIQIKLIFYTLKVRQKLYEESFGLQYPALNLYYYIKLNFFGQKMEEKKGIDSWKN